MILLQNDVYEMVNLRAIYNSNYFSYSMRKTLTLPSPILQANNFLFNYEPMDAVIF